MPTVTYVPTPPVDHGRCYRCGLSVDWIKTVAGKLAPFDPVSMVRDDDPLASFLMFELSPGVVRVRHVSTGKKREGDRLVRHHEVTCPERRGKRRPSRRRTARRAADERNT